MKKFISLLLMLLLALSVCTAEPLPAEVQVYVSITDEHGALVLAYESIAVTDQDNDGALTIGDALLCAHIAKHENGAEAYGASITEYGLSLTRLWGADNGGSFGYYLNDASAWSLLDPVAEGDHVKAFAFTDLVMWSDTYCFFNAPAAQAKTGEEVILSLFAAGYDADYNPVTLPVEGALITVNGEATEMKTDAEGKAALTLSAEGVYVISAKSEAQNLIAPVCVITVSTDK